MNDFAKAVQENVFPDRVPTYPIWVSVDEDDPRHGDTLSFESDCSQNSRLATRDEYESGDRAVGSIFEALDPGDCIRLKEGKFRLDENLDIASKFVIIELTVKEVIQSAWRGQPLAELFTESSPEIWGDRSPIGYQIISVNHQTEKVVFDVEFA